MKAILISVLLAIATAGIFFPSSDDVLWILYALSGRDLGYALIGSPYVIFHEQAPGFLNSVKWLYPHLGAELILWRLISVSIGCAAVALLAYTAKRKDTAIALALLLWSPILFIPFHEIRYDGTILLVMALNLWWLMRSENPWLGVAAGFLAGFAPFFSLCGIFGLVAMPFALPWKWRSLAWAWGAFLGGLLAIHCFPADRFMLEMTQSLASSGTLYRVTPGYQLLGHPLQLLLHMIHVTAPTTPIGFLCAWLFGGCLAAMSFRRPLGRYAVAFVLAHGLLGASVYAVLLQPVLILGGLDALD